jgi:SAM-dependent methyltransferase
VDGRARGGCHAWDFSLAVALVAVAGAGNLDGVSERAKNSYERPAWAYSEAAALADISPDPPSTDAHRNSGFCAHPMSHVQHVSTRDDSLLGDTTARDYSDKLSKFNAFAQPELRGLIRGLDLKSGMHVLDVGCGTGEALNWLLGEVSPSGRVVGIDLAAAHLAAARPQASPEIQLYQANLFDDLFEPASFDLVWCVNTINHLTDPVAGVIHLARLLRDGGRVAIGQSSFLPDMYFAWDTRLESVVNDAVRRYYQDRYDLDEHDLKAVRALVGILRRTVLRNIAVRTIMIERLSPLDAASESYLKEAIFRGTWGERLRPYLSAADYAELAGLCDSDHSNYALRRPDFHFLQTFTLATGEI